MGIDNYVIVCYYYLRKLVIVLNNMDIFSDVVDDQSANVVDTNTNTEADVEAALAKEWESLRITNDFIFCKVMQDKELLTELIHLILPDVEFDDLEIIAQKTIELGADIHGVRFDIYVKSNDGEVFEIEMQVLNQGNLPRRLRFYSSMIDSDILDKGVTYSKLKNSYVIAICPFDYYGYGFHKYTFTNRCHEVDGLEMNDGTTKIVLNALGTMNDVSERLKEFLNYVAGKPSNDEYVRKLDVAVYRAKQNSKWRREFMTLAMRDLVNKEKWTEEGKEEGLEMERKRQIERLLKKGKSIDEIADLGGYTIDYVQKVIKSLSVK